MSLLRESVIKAVVVGLLVSTPLAGSSSEHRFSGHGKVFDPDNRLVASYLVAWHFQETEHGMLLVYNVTSKELSYSRQLIMKKPSGANVAYKVYLPPVDGDPAELATYVEAGWGHKIEFVGDHVTTVHAHLLTYVEDGNQITIYLRGYQNAEGKWFVLHTGSVGNADGLVHTWVDQMEQIVE